MQGQVESRLTDRLQELGLRSLDAYRDYRTAHPDEWARRGCYQHGTLKDLPDGWRDRAFVYDPALDHDKHAEPYCLRPRYRRPVTWRQEDIRTSMPDGPFSLLCCRNLVFTYFDCSLQKRIPRRLLTRLRPGGVLVLGADESLPNGTDTLIEIDDGRPLHRYRPD